MAKIGTYSTATPADADLLLATDTWERAAIATW